MQFGCCLSLSTKEAKCAFVWVWELVTEEPAPCCSLMGVWPEMTPGHSLG